MPNMRDPGFAGSVVYVCEHSKQGAMGLVINQASNMAVDELLDNVDLEITGDLSRALPVMAGGPVSAERGFVLHSTEKTWDSSLLINDSVALTTSRDILEAVACGQAPEKWLVSLGYSGWGHGQLERELSANAWLTVAADLGVLFDLPLEARFVQAYKLLGIDPLSLTGAFGHA